MINYHLRNPSPFSRPTNNELSYQNHLNHQHLTKTIEAQFSFQTPKPKPKIKILTENDKDIEKPISPTRYINDYYYKEVPKFCNENDRNLKRFHSYLKEKEKLIHSNSQNYLNYLIHQKQLKKSASTATSNRLLNIDDNDSNQRESNEQILKSRLNDVTNPDLYYKIANNEYSRYHMQQRKVQEFNNEMIRIRRFKEKIEINPYNRYSNMLLGESQLQHNTILNPLPNYSYNKYLERELKRVKEN